MTRLRGFLCTLAAGLVVAGLASWAPADAAVRPGRAAGSPRAGGESQIDESAPDDSGPAPGSQRGSASLTERVRDYVEGSLARYDALKCDSAAVRRQGWFPSFFLNAPESDVSVEASPGGAVILTVHLSYARKDCEHRLVIAPAEQFELPGADRRFFSELLGALALSSPEIVRARLVFWFATLRPDGRMTWEARGGIGLSAAAARRYPSGSRTAEAIWPALEENTLPPALWPR